MDLHERAWEGFKILIFCQDSLALQMRSTIAECTPISKEQIFTFEKYDDAYSFCKEHKDIGLLIVHENSGELPFIDVFRELSKLSDEEGFPTFGIVCYDELENTTNQKITSKISHLLDYIPVSYFTDHASAGPTIENIWEQICSAFEEYVLPQKLQESLSSCAEETLGADGIHFSLRLTNNFLSALDVSWFENVAIKWAPILNEVNKNTPAVIRPHKTLLRLVDICSTDIDINENNFLSFLNESHSNCQKVFALVYFLNDQRKAGKLEETLNLFATNTNSVQSILIAHVLRNKERILAFESEAQTMSPRGEAA